MPVTQQMAYIALGALAVTGALLLFGARLKWTVKLPLNTLAGVILLTAVSLLGDVLPFRLGLNALTAGTVAVLGLPGFALLLMVQWLFR